ncbi:hypothetical protein LIER_31382 [Lithospermum erythrorhizon]|uniref:Integrase catalytic domain-containing protein n=1 Tax=Lithospermum erythrorhizon TaxID=34254 RepID=A0AAV3RUL2_LITER
MGKYHRATFNKANTRKNGVVKLVYSDCYAIKFKDQVFNHFKSFHVLVERQIGKPLKCIRTDNEGEYIGSFDQYCKDKGIRHEQSVPKTPQHNGVDERMNRTIIENIRCMLSHANLPRSF